MIPHLFLLSARLSVAFIVAKKCRKSMRMICWICRRPASSKTSRQWTAEPCSPMSAWRGTNSASASRLKFAANSKNPKEALPGPAVLMVQRSGSIRDAALDGIARSRHCHLFYFLPTGGGPEGDEPLVGQLKINRALQDAPLCYPGDVLLRSHRRKSGYCLEACLPAAVLNGYDPDQNRRLGFFYAIRDAELGEQLLSAGSVFPYPEDPSLWNVLELKK